MKCTFDKITKFASICCAVLTLILAVQRFTLQGFSRIQDFVITIYYMIFAAILIMAEFNVHYLVKNFALVNNYFGRGLYTLFFGTLTLTATPTYQIIVAVILMTCGVGYMVLYFVEKKQKGNDEAQQGNPREPKRSKEPYQEKNGQNAHNAIDANNDLIDHRNIAIEQNSTNQNAIMGKKINNDVDQ